MQKKTFVLHYYVNPGCPASLGEKNDKKMTKKIEKNEKK